MQEATYSVDQQRRLVVGTVEAVSAAEIKIVLDTDAPQRMALNPGMPTIFPRLNSYVLIPHEAGALVGMISCLTTEPSPYLKRRNLKEAGILDLPFPARKLVLVPIGTLMYAFDDDDASRPRCHLERGVYHFPAVGDLAVLPTAEQLRAIVTDSEGHARVQIGTAPMAANAPVEVDPNRLFGRHLAVLGNTGSGKSCTVAGLIRWCVEAAAEKRREFPPTNGKVAHGRFIVLDPNGEYAKAFADYKGTDAACRVRLFSTSPQSESEKQFTVPAWMWNHREWECFTEAKSGVQRPILFRAIAKARANDPLVPDRKQAEYWLRHLANTKNKTDALYEASPSHWKTIQELDRCLDFVTHCRWRLGELTLTLAQHSAFRSLVEALETQVQNKLLRFENVRAAVETLTQAFPELKLDEVASENADDLPRPFNLADIPNHIDRLAAHDGSRDNHAYVDTLNLRLRTLLADASLMQCIAPEPTPTLEAWLADFLPNDGPDITIIDFSFLSTEHRHLLVAAFARLIFEAHQRWLREGRTPLPTTLVLEEAHVFIRDEKSKEQVSYADLCRESFERIAREGRKFGLGLLLSSQRPSELSPTVLSQCNTFLLHRIVNDRDQELVRRLVPDHIGSLLRELPTLPTQKAILLGWAAPVPVLVEISKLAGDHCPRSDDPNFWAAWTGQEKDPPPADAWRPIANQWQGKSPPDASSAAASAAT